MLTSGSLTTPHCHCERSVAISLPPHLDCFVAYGFSQRQVGAEIAEPVPKRKRGISLLAMTKGDGRLAKTI